MGRRKHTRQDAILDLKRVITYLGRSPTKREYENLSKPLYVSCCARTVINLFGSWNDALYVVEEMYFKTNGQVSNQDKDEIPGEGEV